MKRTKGLSPAEFAKAVRAIAADDEFPDGMPGKDPENSHSQTDQLMEEILTDLGYGTGVKLIRKMKRWYA